MVSGKSPKFIGAFGNLTTKHLESSFAFTQAAEQVIENNSREKLSASS
jgi:hypothetical protein